jgi:hypothetical protein
MTKFSLAHLLLALASVCGAVGCAENTALTAYVACDPPEVV